MKALVTRIKDKLTGKVIMAQTLLRSRNGENFVDTAIKILMAVVIGALSWRGSMLCSGKPCCRPSSSASRICSTMAVDPWALPQLPPLAQGGIFFALLFAASVFDLRKRIIPDTLCC